MLDSFVLLEEVALEWEDVHQLILNEDLICNMYDIDATKHWYNNNNDGSKKHLLKDLRLIATAWIIMRKGEPVNNSIIITFGETSAKTKIRYHKVKKNQAGPILVWKAIWYLLRMLYSLFLIFNQHATIFLYLTNWKKQLENKLEIGLHSAHNYRCNECGAVGGEREATFQRYCNCW